MSSVSKFNKFPRVIIDGASVIDLHNIHKKIFNCKELHIVNQDNVKFNILGLFLLNLEKITSSSLNIPVEWYRIFYNHWNMTYIHDDLLECQEELIKNNLLEYARL